MSQKNRFQLMPKHIVTIPMNIQRRKSMFATTDDNVSQMRPHGSSVLDLVPVRLAKSGAGDTDKRWSGEQKSR